MTRLRVKRLARAAGASPGAVRHYVRIGLLTPVRDSNNGYHLFVLSDVMRFRFIYRAKYLGYTLNEIRQIFEESGKGLSPCPLVRQIIARRIAKNRRELEQAMLLQKRMERALVQWRKMPDGAPDGETICRLIELAVEA
jgi:MerR family transcriptional regulator, Zn(II)-responsive regulator of zntA